MTGIQPFHIEIPEARLDDLKNRIARTRWPRQLRGAGWSRGVPLQYLRELTDYWATGFDWRAEEAKLNALPQFVTEIDGQPIHFVHALSPEPDALPLIITHGYPGSIVEFADIIGPLTNPRAHGGDPADAFHVVAASLPGFVFSTPVGETGWAVGRTAKALAELMRRLGYQRYAAQGGDIGAGIAGAVGAIDPMHVVGVHINSDPMAVNWLLDRFPFDLSALPEGDRRALDAVRAQGADGIGYLKLQSTRPQTIAYALNDSPVGQLAWIAEKFKEWTDSQERPEDAVDRDQLLTNVMLYWLTRTAGSSARIYYERTHSPYASSVLEPSRTPTAVAVFRHENFLPLRHIAEQTDNIVQWSEFDRGGHFAAMEEPDLLIEDLRKFFRPLRHPQSW